jgi:histidyl-tRNA synthetase
VLPNQSQRVQTELIGRRTTHILAALNKHMQLYGYNLVNLPVIESAELFLVKAGDQIINSLFTFERQGKQFALRPEFTASATDYFANTEGNPVVRWQFAGPVFEDKSHESNANYEQLGVGAELIGLSGSLADSEIVAMSTIGLDKLGIANTHITIGHVGLLREILGQFNLDIRTQHFLLHHIPALSDPDKGTRWILDQFINQLSSSKSRSVPAVENSIIGSNETNEGSTLTLGGRTQEDIMRRMLLKQQRLADRNNVSAAINYLDKWCQISDTPERTFDYLARLIPGNINAEKLLKEWRETIRLLESHQIPLSRITIKPNLARSWEYYTGMVFELHSDGVHLGGGGRYDDLAKFMGSKVSTPAVGFAYYGDRLIDMLSNMSLEVEPLITIISSDDDMVSAIKWANQIRNCGLSVQILPQAAQSSPNMYEVYLANATTAHFQTTKYNFQQIDLLINDLKQTR